MRGAELHYISAVDALAAYRAGELSPVELTRGVLDQIARYNERYTLTQQPAIAVPCGFTSSHLPIGLQIVGARYTDALVLRAAYAYQNAHSFGTSRPV